MYTELTKTIICREKSEFTNNAKSEGIGVFCLSNVLIPYAVSGNGDEFFEGCFWSNKTG